MEINGAFVAICMLFFGSYLIAIIIFGKIKKYKIIKLICGLTILWIIVSIIFTGLIYLLTGGSINTVNGTKSSLFLSVFIGIIIGWTFTLCGTLLIIEKVGNNGVCFVASDIIKNGQSILVIRLFQALIVLIFGSALKLIYKFSKKIIRRL
jgi:hypothetical protein